jgi:hypothetical protein
MPDDDSQDRHPAFCFETTAVGADFADETDWERTRDHVQPKRVGDWQ